MPCLLSYVCLFLSLSCASLSVSLAYVLFLFLYASLSFYSHTRTCAHANTPCTLAHTHKNAFSSILMARKVAGERETKVEWGGVEFSFALAHTNL